MRKLYNIFNLFTRCQASVLPSQEQGIIVDVDEMEEPRSISFPEEDDDDDDDWDDDDDDDDDD